VVQQYHRMLVIQNSSARNYQFITINDFADIFDEIPKYLLVLPNISILLVLQDTALITHGTE